MLFIDPKIRFTTNIKHYFSISNKSTNFIITGGDESLHITGTWWPIVLSSYSNVSDITHDWLDLTTWSELLTHVNHWSAHIQYARSWTLHMTDIEEHADSPMSYFLSSGTMTTEMTGMSKEQQMVYEIMNTHPGEYSNTLGLSACIEHHVLPDVKIINDSCTFYREQVLNTYVTHPFFIEPQSPQEYYGEFDTTLLTMFTIDRFGNFERLLKGWGLGPVVVVLYADPLEIIRITSAITESEIVRSHPDITYHLVYRFGVSIMFLNIL